MDIQTLLAGRFSYEPTEWFDKIIDPEGDKSHPGVRWTAKRGNNLESGVKKAHDRLNDLVVYVDEITRTQKDLRLEFLLLKSSVTSGLTSNIFVENLETTEDILLLNGAHDATKNMIYLP